MKMTLDDIGMLAVPNNRSKYYIEKLLEKSLLPAYVLVLDNPSNQLTPGQRPQDLENDFSDLLQTNCISYEVIRTLDVNSEEVVEAIKKRREKIFIYSGPGGAILRKNILQTGKKFLHVHPGRLPDYRGSTTIYYHILQEGSCGVSALFLSEKIDQGPVITTRNVPLPSDTDLDYDFDPRIRAELLCDVIKLYSKRGRIDTVMQGGKSGETYYIIHPVLRHIAKLSLEK
jgi:methionyl-tRNA formyltransferase